MKKILSFLLFFLPWFLPSLLFGRNTSFYQEIALPSFAPPSWVFMAVWTILYLMIAYSIYLVFHTSSTSKAEYYKALLINYGFSFLFPFFFFTLQNLFLSFLDTIGVLLSALLLYYETKQLNEKAAKWLIPYLLWCLFAVILSLSIYFIHF